MSKGAKSFLGFSAVVTPAIILYALYSGLLSGLLAFAGLFVVLVLCNRMDRQ